jgi:hypothetical protein
LSSPSQGRRAWATQARRNSHLVPSPSADSYAAAAEAAAAAAMRLISAHIRVLGEAYVRLWFPAPDAAVGSDAVAMPTPRLGLPPPKSVSSRRTSTHVGARHQREAAIDKEMAAAPNVLSVTRTRDALARYPYISKVPVDFGGAFRSSVQS